MPQPPYKLCARLPQTLGPVLAKFRQEYGLDMPEFLGTCGSALIVPLFWGPACYLPLHAKDTRDGAVERYGEPPSTAEDKILGVCYHQTRVVEGDPTFLEEGRRLWQTESDATLDASSDTSLDSDADSDADSESTTDIETHSAQSSSAAPTEEGAVQQSVVVLFVPTDDLAEYHAQVSAKYGDAGGSQDDPAAGHDTDSSTSEPEPWLPYYVVGHTTNRAQAEKAVGAAMRVMRDVATFVPVDIVSLTPDGAMTPM